MPIPRSVVLVPALAILTALPASASAANCPLSESAKREMGVKPGYVTELRVSGTSCKRGKEVVRAFHACRYAAGGKRGRCRRAVLGYSCKEHTREGTASLFTSAATCRKGGARVFHRYSQFT